MPVQAATWLIHAVSLAAIIPVTAPLARTIHQCLDQTGASTDFPSTIITSLTGFILTLEGDFSIINYSNTLNKHALVVRVISLKRKKNLGFCQVFHNLL
ncbi:hypothetical protein [Desulfosarcina variabilis]|uniref:hypothetical protein n=1 Tax=Desulfosarcina variabilis TaxID=2300 RepID=UPI003AFA5440